MGFQFNSGHQNLTNRPIITFYLHINIDHELKRVIWMILRFVLVRVLFCMKTRVSILSNLIKILKLVLKSRYA